MKNALAILALSLISAGAAFAQIEPEMLLTLKSTEFSEGAELAAEYSCDGRNVNPPLTIDRVPEQAKSLVIVVEDRDAPSGIFTHWLVWNIDPKRTDILTDTVPDGAVQGKNDFGKVGYSGPCKPAGVHRYFFTLFALNDMIELPEGSSRAQLSAAMQGKVLQMDSLVGKYASKAENSP